MFLRLPKFYKFAAFLLEPLSLLAFPVIPAKFWLFPVSHSIRSLTNAAEIEDLMRTLRFDKFAGSEFGRTLVRPLGPAAWMVLAIPRCSQKLGVFVLTRQRPRLDVAARVV